MNRLARWPARMAVLFGLVSPSALLAQEPARSLDELARWIRIGDQVTVTEATGRTATGRVADLHPDTLALAVGEAVRDFPQDQIATISRREHDSLRNGALIGAGVGAGLFLAALASSGWCAYESDCGPMMLIGTLFYTGVGAGIGVGVDALVPGRQAVIFRRPAGRVSLGLSPHLVAGRRGVALSLSF